VTFQFGVTPRSVVLNIPHSGTYVSLRAARLTSWRISRLGRLSITLKAKAGTASYAILLAR
jgi:hypothetical protein